MSKAPNRLNPLTEREKSKLHESAMQMCVSVDVKQLQIVQNALQESLYGSLKQEKVNISAQVLDGLYQLAIAPEIKCYNAPDKVVQVEQKLTVCIHCKLLFLIYSIY